MDEMKCKFGELHCHACPMQGACTHGTYLYARQTNATMCHIMHDVNLCAIETQWESNAPAENVREFYANRILRALQSKRPAIAHEMRLLRGKWAVRLLYWCAEALASENLLTNALHNELARYLTQATQCVFDEEV